MPAGVYQGFAFSIEIQNQKTRFTLEDLLQNHTHLSSRSGRIIGEEGGISVLDGLKPLMIHDAHQPQ
jgi:hypothetical protein